MPRIIDYPEVLSRLAADGLHCNYHNSGSFGFPSSAGAKIRGWIGPEDSTIRQEMRGFLTQVAPPYASNLVKMTSEVWQTKLPGAAWVMPASHWSFELTYGSREWLVPLLADIGVDSNLLAGRTNGSAIEFEMDEAGTLGKLVAGLLENLKASDFMLAFPGRRTVCAVHHHQQMWWVSLNDEFRMISEGPSFKARSESGAT